MATAIGIVAAGLASRACPGILPATLGNHPGDALWAMLVFVLLCLLRPRASTWTIAAVALLVAFAVEFAQFLQWPWLVALRRTTPGHLVLGQGFDPVDLIAYTIGIALAAAADRIRSRGQRNAHLNRSTSGSPCNP